MTNVWGLLALLAFALFVGALMLRVGRRLTR
ncbi:hypothetical protein KST_03949 [Mycobacterium marinum]|nr:hypothetical protein KST_03949 [Mycobacterium marinum]